MNHNHTKRNGADHWWWIPTAGGVAVTAAIAAIAIVPLGGSAAIPVPVDGSGTSASHDPGGGKRDPGAWMRPCFRVQPNWNDAEGPQPRCPKPRFTGSERAAALARAPIAPPATCPSVPDPRYVGVPWYSPVDGCPDVTYWWRSLDVLP
jgi:hypothetical protein